LRVPEQVARIAVVLGLILVVVLLVRFVVVPRSYFSAERHQAATVERELAKPISFAGADACRECHEEQFATKSKGHHQGLACETCHGPSSRHAGDPLAVKPFAPRDRKFCPVCHAYDSARPTGFPQINPMVHNPLKPCIACHDPHDPAPPEAPKDCSACHAQIARTKALSAHALLPCTTCHTAGKEHWVAPRSALPTKPEAREFCGQCHATGAANPEAPKIDLAAHGGSYLCWQCHYPHLPEGR
jgi:DnaJ-class molecular chaperone